MERTEEEKVIQAPISVILGGEQYDVKPLVIRDSRLWRQKVAGMLAPLPGLVSTNSDDPEAFGQALTQLLVDTPDMVVDLFFDYAKELNREEIENVATDAEMRDAFQEIVKYAFPLVEALPATMAQIAPPAAQTRRRR